MLLKYASIKWLPSMADTPSNILSSKFSGGAISFAKCGTTWIFHGTLALLAETVEALLRLLGTGTPNCGVASESGCGISQQRKTKIAVQNPRCLLPEAKHGYRLYTYACQGGGM